MHDISEPDFLAVTGTIQAAYPTKRIFLVEYQSVIAHLTSSYIRDVTDIGFNYYLSLQSNNETAWDTYLTAFHRMKHIAPGRRIWVIPDGSARTPDRIPRWFDAFEKYLGLAMTTENAEGIANFTWHPIDGFPIALKSVIVPGTTYYDAGFRARHVNTGNAITRNNAVPPSHTMYYCRTDTRSCRPTTNAGGYSWASDCEANLNSVLRGYTTGVCYDTPGDCSRECFPNPTPTPYIATRYDTVIQGAGTGGIGAAIQAARMGSSVLLLEETDSLGGQLSAMPTRTIFSSGGRETCARISTKIAYWMGETT